MAPFLSDALFDERSAYPLELIILARKAAVDFDNRHRVWQVLETHQQSTTQVPSPIGPLLSTWGN